MASLKAALKKLFIATNTLPLLDRLNYTRAILKYRSANKEFVKNHPDFKLPPDYYLYETYKLDYSQYKEDGFVTAKEISDWTVPYLPETKHILEWGCGVSRIIRHFPGLITPGSRLSACDINDVMIQWNKKNIPGVDFKTIDYNPPTPYNDASFHLIYALSVFTHIEASMQPGWVAEIARITKSQGIFLFTTHGTDSIENLSPDELKEYNEKGSYTMSYKQKGHKMMSTYNDSTAFRDMIAPYFDVLEFYHGKDFREKVGGQDLWIVRRR